MPNMICHILQREQQKMGDVKVDLQQTHVDTIPVVLTQKENNISEKKIHNSFAW